MAIGPRYSVKLSTLVDEFNLTKVYTPPHYESVRIVKPDLNRPGMQLVGFFSHFDNERIQLMGTVEIVGCSPASKYIWLAEESPVALSGTSGSADRLMPGEGGDCSRTPCAVYGTLFFGKDAFGVVDPEGMGMEMIIKDAAQIGGPLNQFSTVGYKFETAAKILYQNRMVRVESCSAYSAVDEAN